MDNNAESSQNKADKDDDHSPDDEKDQDGTPSYFLFAVKHPNNRDAGNGDEVNHEKDQDGAPFSSVAITLAVKNRTNVDFEDGVEDEKISDLMD